MRNMDVSILPQPVTHYSENTQKIWIPFSLCKKEDENVYREWVYPFVCRDFFCDAVVGIQLKIRTPEIYDFVFPGDEFALHQFETGDTNYYLSMLLPSSCPPELLDRNLTLLNHFETIFRHEPTSKFNFTEMIGYDKHRSVKEGNHPVLLRVDPQWFQATWSASFLTFFLKMLTLPFVQGLSPYSWEEVLLQSDTVDSSYPEWAYLKFVKDKMNRLTKIFREFDDYKHSIPVAGVTLAEIKQRSSEERFNWMDTNIDRIHHLGGFVSMFFQDIPIIKVEN